MSLEMTLSRGLRIYAKKKYIIILEMSNERRQRSPQEDMGRKLRQERRRKFKSRARYHAACDSVDEKSLSDIPNLNDFRPDQLHDYILFIYRQYIYAKHCHERRSQHRIDFFAPKDWDKGHAYPIEKHQKLAGEFLKELERIAKWKTEEMMKQDDLNQAMQKLSVNSSINKQTTSKSKSRKKKSKPRTTQISIQQQLDIPDSELDRLIEQMSHIEDENQKLLEEKCAIVMNYLTDAFEYFDSIVPAQFGGYIQSINKMRKEYGFSTDLTFSNRISQLMFEKSIDKLSSFEIEQLPLKLADWINLDLKTFLDVIRVSMAELYGTVIILKFVNRTFKGDDTKTMTLVIPLDTLVGDIIELVANEYKPLKNLLLEQPFQQFYVIRRIGVSWKHVNPDKKVSDVFKNNDEFRITFVDKHYLNEALKTGRLAREFMI
jgi:hypothetical protein